MPMLTSNWLKRLSDYSEHSELYDHESGCNGWVKLS
jgi:hypothetical protein